MFDMTLNVPGAYASWLSERAAGSAGDALAREAVRAAGCALPRCPAPAALALRRLCCDCSAAAAELVVDIVRVAQAQVSARPTTSVGFYLIIILN